MVNKVTTLVCGCVVVISLSTFAFAGELPAATKAMKQTRWEGNVIRSSPDQSSLTVRKLGENAEMTVHYNSSTRWVSQEHASKAVNNIDATQVKDGDRVIVRGTWDKGVLQANLISKRLSHSK